jgi:hypothetical protein
MPLLRSLDCLITLVASLAILASAPTHDTAMREGLQETLRLAGDYVRQFEVNLRVVLSDELYDQRVLLNGSSKPFAQRKTKAEWAFVEIPDEHNWIAIRNVVELNGAKIDGNRGRIDTVLTGALADQPSRFHALAVESARYNIGNIYRNFNDPTLAVLFFDPANQVEFQFKHTGYDTVAGERLARVEYREQRRHTQIGSNGPKHGVNGSGVDRFCPRSNNED